MNCAVAQKCVIIAADKIREALATQMQPGVNFMSRFLAFLKEIPIFY